MHPMRGKWPSFRTSKPARRLGPTPKTLDHAEIVAGDGHRNFRYMKAIITQEVCTTCHGSSIAPEIVAQLDALYPVDQARGFAAGDIRGAFTIVQPLE